MKRTKIKGQAVLAREQNDQEFGDRPVHEYVYGIYSLIICCDMTQVGRYILTTIHCRPARCRVFLMLELILLEDSPASK